jgi:hypothetical protein
LPQSSWHASGCYPITEVCGQASEAEVLMSVGFRIAPTSRLIMGTFICAAGLGAPLANAEECFSSTQRGTYDGYFYSLWTEGGGSTNFYLQPNGRFTSQWSNVDSWSAA